MTAAAKPLHLHIENSTPLGSIFEITPARLSNAVKRHNDIASDLRITVGKDGVNFDENISNYYA